MSDPAIARPVNPADDWKVWLVVNPATWLIPILLAVLVLALAVHDYVFSIPGFGWSGPISSDEIPQPAAESPIAPAAIVAPAEEIAASVAPEEAPPAEEATAEAQVAAPESE